MAHRYRGGRVAPVSGAAPRLADIASGVVRRYRAALDDYELHAGMAAAFDLIDATNEFITRSEPWVLAKSPDRGDDLDQALFEMVEAVRIAALLLWPAMPSSCAEIWRRMGGTRPIAESRLDADAAWSGGERQVVQGPPLWPRLEAGASAGETAADAAGVAAAKGTGTTMTDDTPPAAPLDGTDPASSGQPPGVSAPAPVAPAPPEDEPRISFDDFMKIQLRVVKVLAAEAIPKSKKLLKVTVDDGTGERTLVAGIARAYAPDTLVGRSVVIVANLEKAKLMGVESNGMILAATDPDGQPVLLGVDDPEAAPPGARVR
jgi:methionyl-tRNA synthetase